MLTPIKTGDGSSTFYSDAFGEWFHNRAGACHEAQQTYVEASRLARRVQAYRADGEPLKILDVCYGLGYNTAAALNTIWAVNADCAVEMKALEIDGDVARNAIAQKLLSRYAPATQEMLAKLAQPTAQGVAIARYQNCHAELLLGDARQTIQPLVAQGWRADVIFLDPFSPPNCPQLWTTAFLQQVAHCLDPASGILVTYSCSAAVRAALLSSGLAIGTLSSRARKYPGTVACHVGSFMTAELLALSQQEQEHMQTRAAVPYRDPTLQATAEDILQRRSQEQSTSPLIPTKPWRRRWAKHMKKSPYLVDVHWLAQRLNPSKDSEPSKVVVIDTRFSLANPDLGRSQYAAGHIPGAYYLDLNQDLSSEVQSHGGRHPLPDWNALAAKLSRFGIYSAASDREPTQVVIYDDSRFAFAARLWWMLRYLGHDKAAILDGGIKAWEKAGYPLSADMPEPEAGEFVPQYQPGWIVDIEDVRQRKDLDGVTVIDSRSPERYRGEVEPIDPVAGSVPGAINSFWQQITDESGQIKSTSELKEHWSQIDPNSEVIVYCGSGVTACVNLFSLVAAGHPMHKLYPGGWSDWCTDTEFTDEKE